MQTRDSKNGIAAPLWVTADGPSDDVALSTRARLARNLKGIPFPTRASDAHLKRAADLVLDAIYNVDDRVDKLRVLYPSRLSEQERLALVNARLASRYQVDSGRYHPIVLNDEGSLSLMVNEEDHLRIQCILPGMQPMTALELALKFDNMIGAKIQYAKTDNYGYLTSSLANIGTGLRLSVMLHLAGLSFLDEAVEVLEAAAQLRTSVRGLFGEGTKALGDIFQVSNETTMGFTAREITSRVRAAAEHLISREHEARRKIAAERKEELADIAAGVKDRLRCIAALSGTDAMACLSLLRLASAVGADDMISTSLFRSLLVAIQLGTSVAGGGPPRGDTLSNDLRRAKLMRTVWTANDR